MDERDPTPPEDSSEIVVFTGEHEEVRATVDFLTRQGVRARISYGDSLVPGSGRFPHGYVFAVVVSAEDHDRAQRALARREAEAGPRVAALSAGLAQVTRRTAVVTGLWLGAEFLNAGEVDPWAFVRTGVVAAVAFAWLARRDYQERFYSLGPGAE